MSRTLHYVDRKRAASGERDDEMEGALWPTESLLETTSMVKTRPSTRMVDKPVKEAEPKSKATAINFDAPIARQVRVLEAATYDVDQDKFKESLNEFTSGWLQGNSKHIQDDREIVVTIGRNHPGDKFIMGYVDVMTLKYEPIVIPMELRQHAHESTLVMEASHSLLRRIELDRRLLDAGDGKPYFEGMIAEIGFSSRCLVTGELSFIGKTKLFFPKEYAKMMVYLDLSRLAWKN